MSPWQSETGMRLFTSICFTAAAFAVASAAQAQPAATSPTTSDARCLLAMVALSNSTNADQQRLGQGGIIYFTGRIAGRDPSFDFQSLKALAAKMDMAAAQTDLQQHCGPMFNKSMQQLGSALSPPAGAASPAPARPAAPTPPKP
jgi:hypothetical protein